MSLEYLEPQITTSDELLLKVENNLNVVDPDIKSLNEDWKKSGIALTAANLLSNIFVDGGLTGQNDVISYFCLKIYGTKNPSSEAHPDKDEIQEVLNLGYSEI